MEDAGGQNGKTAAEATSKPRRLVGKTGDLDKVAELAADDEYVIDGRIRQAHLGFGWKTAQVDVDASLAVFDKAHKCLDVIWWDKKYSRYVSAEHLNDDRTGSDIPTGKDTNETILIEFSKLPKAVCYILAVVTVYSKGKSLKDVSDMFLKLSYQAGGGQVKDLLKYKPGSFDTAAAVVGTFYRNGAWWNFIPQEKAAVGRTIKEVVFNFSVNQVIMKAALPGKSFMVYTWVVEGSDLAASDKPVCGKSSSDCYAEIKFNNRRCVSEVIVKDLNPKWSMVKFELGTTNESDCDVIEYNVWDHDTTSEDDFLGAVHIAAGGICQKGVGSHEMTLSLGPSVESKIKPQKGVKIKGQIKIKFEVVELAE